MKKQSGIREFGRTRLIVIIWLIFLLICSANVEPMMSFVVILCILYMIGMDRINGRFVKDDDVDLPMESEIPLTKDEPDSEPPKKPAKKPAKEEPVVFENAIKCPFCGKDIPPDIKYCYYCGKSLETFRKIEAIRVESVAKLEKAAGGVDKEDAKAGILAVKDLTDKILRKYEEKSELTSDYTKFTEYYLPKSIAAIEHYQVLCGLEGLDNSKLEVKDQLEESIGMIKEAFTNIFNRLSTEGIYDLSADVSALEKGLQLDGLTDSDFNV